MVVAMVFGVPMGVRRVARTTGPLERAVGFGVMHQRGGPWCFANMATTGLTDRSTRFHLAFHAALRSRGIRLVDRRISGAAWRRSRRPSCINVPPRTAAPS